MYTYQEFLEAEDRTQWLRKTLAAYVGGPEYRKAKMEEEYLAGRDTAIMETVKVIYDLTGKALSDFTAASTRISSNILHSLVRQRCSYSLGNGISFAGAVKERGTDGRIHTIDATKQALGNNFDNAVFRAAYWACGNGESYTYIHRGYNRDEWVYDVFKRTEFIALKDEYTGELRGGVRFWSLDWNKKPITAIIYTEEGYQRFQSKAGEKGPGSLEPVTDILPYEETIRESIADGLEVVDGTNYSTLPIIPLYPNETKTAALDNLKAKIDVLDLALSGFASDMQNAAQVYWIVNGAMGATDDELVQMRDKAKLLGILNIDGEHSSITPYTQEPPYNAREVFIQRIVNQIYMDYGCVDVTGISAQQRTATELEASFEPMNQEADAFEYQLIEYIQKILTVIGLDDIPVFSRSQVHNQKELTDMVMSAADILDTETIVRKLPFISIDEVEDVLDRIEAKNLTDKRDLEALENAMQESEEENVLEEIGSDGGEIGDQAP